MRSNRLSPLAFCLVTGIVAALGLTACKEQKSNEPAPAPAEAPQASAKASVAQQPFGTLPDGSAVQLYTLTNASGMEVGIINYGGIVTSIKVPDRDGKIGDVVLGFDNIDGFAKNPPYFGAIIGRYGNRIGQAQFTLDGKTYKLFANNNGNTLHGGMKGFDKVMWQSESFEKPGEVGVVLNRTSADGEEGFPGNLTVKVTYTLTDANELAIDYSAKSDKPTIVNLTNHAYFNLAGEGAGDILSHVVTLNADRFTPVDKTLIPLGELANVEGTPFDFRKATPIGERIDADHEQLKLGGGYDHNFVINGEGSDLKLAARVEEPKSGRVMEVRTTEPGVQLYTGNFLDGLAGKAGHAYSKRNGFCLETQHFPDSPNKPSFPTTRLNPGDEYRSRTVYAFSAK